VIETYATTAGAPATGSSGSKCRIMPTPEGAFYVKFVRSDSDAWHGPLNELLANRLLEAIGCERPTLGLVRLHAAIRDSEPSLAAVEHGTGLGIASLPLAIDLYGPAILAAAQTAPDVELLAQHAVLTWVQNIDHRGKNFVSVGDRVVAIDFAGSPFDTVWAGRPLTEDRIDHGSLGTRLAAIPGAIRDAVLDRLRSVSDETLGAILEQAPSGWSTPAEREHIVAEAMRTKEGVVANYR
jgi:hypothetical protein